MITAEDLTRAKEFCESRGIPTGHACAFAVFVQNEKRTLQNQVLALRNHLNNVLSGRDESPEETE